MKTNSANKQTYTALRITRQIAISFFLRSASVKTSAERRISSAGISSAIKTLKSP